MRLTVVCVFSFCFLCTSGASCGVACHLRSLLTAPPQLADIMAQQESGPSVSLAVCFSACDPNHFGLACRDHSCQRSVFSGLAARAESARTPRRSVPDRHRAAASLGVSFLQLEARQSNFSEISRRPFQGHAVPTDLPSGAGCHTETIPERSKRPSPCVSSDFESSLRFAGIVIY